MLSSCAQWKSGSLLSDLPTGGPAAEHFELRAPSGRGGPAAGMTYVMIGQHFLFPGSRWLQPIPLLARLAGELDHVKSRRR